MPCSSSAIFSAPIAHGSVDTTDAVNTIGAANAVNATDTMDTADLALCGGAAAAGVTC